MNRMHKLSPYLFWFGFALLLLVAFAQKVEQSRPPNEYIVGNNLPEFSLPAFDAEGEQLSNKSIKTPALINFFGSWCNVCKYEHKYLVQLAKQEGINIYGIAWRDKATDLRMFLARFENPYQKIAMDENSEMVKKFAVTGVPETLVIDRNGKVLERYKSNLNEEIVEEIKGMLQEKF